MSWVNRVYIYSLFYVSEVRTLEFEYIMQCPYQLS